MSARPDAGHAWHEGCRVRFDDARDDGTGAVEDLHFGAGGQREAIAQIATIFGQALGLTVATQFGHPAGCVNASQRANTSTSSPRPVSVYARNLVRDGRAGVIAMFACNTVYPPEATLVDSPPELHVCPEHGAGRDERMPPAAMLLALSILSPIAQKVLAVRDFKPVADLEPVSYITPMNKNNIPTSLSQHYLKEPLDVHATSSAAEQRYWPGDWATDPFARRRDI